MSSFIYNYTGEDIPAYINGKPKLMTSDIISGLNLSVFYFIYNKKLYNFIVPDGAVGVYIVKSYTPPASGYFNMPTVTINVSDDTVYYGDNKISVGVVETSDWFTISDKSSLPTLPIISSISSIPTWMILVIIVLLILPIIVFFVTKHIYKK